MRKERPTTSDDERIPGPVDARRLYASTSTGHNFDTARNPTKWKPIDRDVQIFEKVDIRLQACLTQVSGLKSHFLTIRLVMIIYG